MCWAYGELEATVRCCGAPVTLSAPTLLEPPKRPVSCWCVHTCAAIAGVCGAASASAAVVALDAAQINNLPSCVNFTCVMVASKCTLLRSVPPVVAGLNLLQASLSQCWQLLQLVQVYKSPHLWNWQLSPKWKFAYMDLVKSMASAAQGHQTWMLAWRCGSKLLREYASSMRKEHQIEVGSFCE